MIKKLLLSLLVVFTFIAYAVRERLVGSNSNDVGSPDSIVGVERSNSSIPSTSSTSSPPAQTSTTTDVALYKDGQFTGDNADAYWGNVEVEAIIQGGKITDVQFLDYPHDRRTSMYINSQAMPWLTSEAVQVQSARVNVISGATLTSEAFIQSLQSALNKAKNAT